MKADRPAAAESLWQAFRRVQTDDKIVRHRVLNGLGCQVGRVVAAEALVRLRRRRLRTAMTDVETALIRDGVATIEGFVPSADFDRMLDEVDRAERQLLTKHPSPDKFGIVRQKISVRKYPDLFPLTVGLLLGSSQLLRVARLAEGWSERDDFTNHDTALTYERLEQATDETTVSARRDAEVSSGDLHADTFHYVTKAFLTLNDVTIDNSPYEYAIGTHRLTLGRLVWEYRNSLRQEQYTTGEYHNRIWEAEQRRLAIAAEPLEVPKNTLIVTNTFGFHRRGSMRRKGAVRRMLRVDFRSNPFHR